MTRPLRLAVLALAAAALATGCSRPAETTVASASAPLPAAPTPSDAAAVAHDAAGIAWQRAASDADVDAAFAQARAESRPVFLYWGASWCPPCNQVKATLFNRQDFIARSRAFVPVYIDGDTPGAQKLGARFKVSGYPTMLLFNPQGVEMTRLPGEVEADRYTDVLTLGMNARRPVREVLEAARTGGTGLAPNDWRLLAFYSWETADPQWVSKKDLPALLAQLAATCPSDQPETASRLHLQALAATDPNAAPAPDPAAREALLRLLADPAAARSQMDVLTNAAAAIVRAASGRDTAARVQLVDSMDAVLARFEGDPTLSRADRLTALSARVELATIDDPAPNGVGPATPHLPPALLEDIRAQAARADREIVDGYERQAVITTAADLLQQAGLGAESDALLQANLSKSHSPYYLMSELASHARARGDTSAALRWYQQAFDRSEGPATRLQWGASYLHALVDLAPQDEPRIESAAGMLFGEAARQPDAFYERSGRSLQRIGNELTTWNRRGDHRAVLRRLQTRLDPVCAALDPLDDQHPMCTSLLAPTGLDKR